MMRVVATIGLHGSASTWVFNIARELMAAAYGEDEVRSLYAETLGELKERYGEARRHLVLKSHHGSVALDAWLTSVSPAIVLSVRDPRDASLSMAERFNVA